MTQRKVGLKSTCQCSKQDQESSNTIEQGTGKASGILASILVTKFMTD